MDAKPTGDGDGVMGNRQRRVGDPPMVLLRVEDALLRPFHCICAAMGDKRFPPLHKELFRNVFRIIAPPSVAGGHLPTDGRERSGACGHAAHA